MDKDHGLSPELCLLRTVENLGPGNFYGQLVYALQDA